MPIWYNKDRNDDMTIEENIKEFKSDIKNTELSDEYIVRRFLCHGSTHILNDSLYFELKENVSKFFDIHPNEILMIGSGKLGFSIAPDKLWNHFDMDSDIDLAIISNGKFNDFWDQLIDFNINLKNRTIEDEKLYNKFIKYFFNGWIRPDFFPFTYKGKNEWFSFFNKLTSDFFEYGEHKISAGLYRDFKTFEMYHINNIKNIRKVLKGEDNG